MVVAAVSLTAQVGCGKKAAEAPKPAVSEAAADAGPAPKAEVAATAAADAGATAAVTPAPAADDAGAAPAAPDDDASTAASAAPDDDASAAPADDASAAAPSEAAAADATAAEAKGSLDETCAAIAKTTDAAFAKVEAQKKEKNGQADKDWPDLIPRKGIGACVAGPGGAWAIEVTDGEYHTGSADYPGGSSYMSAKLVFVDAQGARTELAFDPTEDHDGSNLAIGVAMGRWWTVEAVSDWRGDGTAEVALRREHRSPEEGGSWIELYHLAAPEGGGKPQVARWTPLGDTFIEKVADEDGDGRLDLFTYQVFRRYVSLGEEIPTNPDGLYYFHHALADGTFETGGDAAKAYYRKACGGAKVGIGDIALGAGAKVEGVLAKAGCARLYGAKVEDLRKHIDPFLKKARGAEDLDPSEEWLAEVPVTLE